MSVGRLQWRNTRSTAFSGSTGRLPRACQKSPAQHIGPDVSRGIRAPIDNAKAELMRPNINISCRGLASMPLFEVCVGKLVQPQWQALAAWYTVASATHKHVIGPSMRL